MLTGVQRGGENTDAEIQTDDGTDVKSNNVNKDE